MFLACAGRCSLSPCVRVVPGVFGGRTARAGVVACCWARAWCEATRVGVACLLRPPLFWLLCGGAYCLCGWARGVYAFWFCAYWVRERWCVRRVWVSFACPRAMFEREIR